MKIHYGRIGFAILCLIGLIGGCAFFAWPYVQPLLPKSPPVVAPTSAPVAQATSPAKPTVPAGVQPTVIPTAFKPTQSNLPKFYVGYPGFVTYHAIWVGNQFAEGIEIVYIPIGLNGKYDYSEAEQAKLLSEGIDGVILDALFSTKEKGVLYPGMGKIVYPAIDETAGGDYMICRLNNVNEIGKANKTKIAYSDGSISMILTFGTLDLISLTPDKVTLAPKPNLTAAVDAYLKKEVDCVAGWSSSDMDEADKAPGSKVVMSTANYRLAMDSIFVSNKTINDKPAQVLAFLKTFVRGANLMWKDPQQATDQIMKMDPIGDWSGITSVNDLNDQLALVAPATFGQNVVICQDQKRFIDRLIEDKNLLVKFGVKVADQKPEDLIDCRFVLVLADLASKDATLAGQLKHSVLPPNPTFNYVGGVEMPKFNTTAKVENFATTQVIFQPGSRELTAQDQARLLELINKLMKFSNTYFRVTAMAALPIGPDFDRPSTLRFAASRVVAVTDFLKANGVPANRIIVGEGVDQKNYPGALEPQHPRMAEDDIKGDRKAVIDVVGTGY